MENNREVLLKVDHLCQYFRLGRKDLKAVDDVNFEIRKGETFGLVGESGSGKTTIGRAIARINPTTAGFRPLITPFTHLLSQNARKHRATMRITTKPAMMSTSQSSPI